MTMTTKTTTMTSETPEPSQTPEPGQTPEASPAQRRKFGLLLLGIGGALVVIIVAMVALNRQFWMLAFLVLTIPNFYTGLRELRASRTTQS